MANQFTRCPDRSHLWCAPPHLIACSLIFFFPIRSSKIASHCKKNANLSISEPSRLTSDHFFFRKNTRDPPLKNSHVEVVLFDVTDTSQKKSIRTGKPASTSIKQKPKPGGQSTWVTVNHIPVGRAVPSRKLDGLPPLSDPSGECLLPSLPELWREMRSGSFCSLSCTVLTRANIRDSESWDNCRILRALVSFSPCYCVLQHLALSAGAEHGEFREQK